MHDLNAIGSTVESLNENVDELLGKLAGVHGLLEQIEKRFEQLPTHDEVADLAAECQSICLSLKTAAQHATAINDRVDDIQAANVAAGV